MLNRSVYEIKYGRHLLSREDCENWRWAERPIARRWFFSAYAEDLQFTPVHQSASLIARGETTFHAGVTNRAWVWRSYVFRQRPETLMAPLPELEPRFYGFVHFWNNPFEDLNSPRNDTAKYEWGEVAEAYLAPPERFLRPHYYVLQIPATTFYGVLPTLVSPLCMPRHYAFGLCAQCVAHSALVLSSSWGATPLSLLDITWLGRNCDVKEQPEEIKLEGLDLHQIARAISSHNFTHCEVANEGFALPGDVIDGANWPKWTAMIGSLICDILASRLPVVAMVDSAQWFELAYPHRNVPEILDINIKTHRNHSVLIVGFHTAHENDNKVRLICHDPAVGPFVEVPVDVLLRSTIYYSLNNPSGSQVDALSDDKHTETTKMTQLGFITPRPQGASLALTAARMHYLKRFSSSGLAEPTTKLRMRFFHHSDFCTIYQRQLAWGVWQGNIKQQFIKHLREKWCNAHYFIGVEDMREGQRRVYLYDASRDNTRVWGWIDKDNLGQLIVEIFDEDQRRGTSWRVPPTSSLT